MEATEKLSFLLNDKNLSEELKLIAEKVLNSERITFEEGVYLIGKDIEPGIYRVEGHGYIQNLRNIFLDTQGQIEDMMILQDGEIVEFEVVEGTYAVRLMGVTAIKVK